MEKINYVNQQERTFSMLSHLSALAMFIFPALGAVLGPLIIWLLKKDEFSEVDRQGKEALNFQLSMLIYYVIAGLLVFAIIGTFLLMILGVANVIIIIIASVKSYNGEIYNYPYSFIFIK